MNRVSIIGRLTRDPELRALSSGEKVCELRLAVDGLGAGRETGYIDVSSWGAGGEAAARTVRKGWLVAVDGRLEYRAWETDDGTKRTAYRVVGSIDFLASPRTNANENATNGNVTTEDAPGPSLPAALPTPF